MWHSLREQSRRTSDKSRTRRTYSRLGIESLEDRCSPSSVVDLGTLGGYNCNGFGINNSGLVVGAS
jgi:hypothetical protein